MSKNTTRKGLAFGAGLALVASGFVSLPANASGIDNGSVSLAPNAGAEYDIIAGASFELKANMATGVVGSGKYLKFLVEDSAQDVSATSGQYSVAGAAHGSVTVATTFVTIPIANHLFKVGDVVEVAGYTASPAINGTRTITSIVAGGSGSITFNLGVTAAVPTASSSPTVKVAAETNRAASGNYVIDTKSDSNSADKVIRLASTDKNATQTVSVTAWVDSNDNGAIDTTEYVSPKRTVNFLASSAITSTTAILPAYVGQSTVQAEVTFSPVLNGAQLEAAYNRNGAINAVQVNFTRPGSVEVEPAATVTYSNVSKKFTATSKNMNSADWAIAQPTANILLQSVKIDTQVVTATTSTTARADANIAAHGLQVGDKVTVASATTGRADKVDAVISAVPTTSTFRYKETATTGADVAATAQSGGTVTPTYIARNFVVAGQYSAQAQLFRFDATLTDALTNIGGVTVATVGATVADAAEFAGVATANTNTDGKVRTGTTSATIVFSVLDEDGDAVPAGVNVSMTAIRHAGSGNFTVNGATVGSTSTALAGVTDANGQVSLAVTHPTGAAGTTLRLSGNAQGAADNDFDVIWENAVYSIVDLNDSSAVGSPARNRTAGADGSYTFDLVVLDQFKSPAPATVRLLATVTGRTTNTTPVALTNGRAKVTVSPDGSAVTGDTTVAMEFQTQTVATGLWTTQDTAGFVDWAQAHNNDLAPVAIKFYNQTDRVTLNANGANFPSTTTAVRTANVTTKALKAVDLRTANDAAEVYLSSTKAVVSGAVTNSVTGAAKLGGVVTMSGAGLLFNVGDVWATGSITFIANDGSFAVDVYSRVAGKQTVTVASGAVTSTAELTFNAVGTITGYSVNLVTPASAAPGTSFKVEGQVRDVNGNPVVIATAGTGANPTLTVTYNGPGLVSGTLPTTTNAAGTFSFFVLLGSNDRGTATVTATYDADGTGTASAAVNKTNTVVIGAGATAYFTKRAGDKIQIVSQGSAKVRFMLNGKRVATRSSLGTLNRTFDLAAGKNVIEIYVDGERVLRRAATK